jgi:hypothetical protein
MAEPIPSIRPGARGEPTRTRSARRHGGLTDRQTATHRDERAVRVLLRAQEVSRYLRADAPADRLRTGLDGRRVIARAQSYLHIPRC